MAASGACFCGGVRFALARIKSVVHCHCSMCRRAHGAAFVTWATVKRSDFQLDDGKGLLTTFRSSPEAVRRFCRRCGTMMFFEGERWADEVHVARALICQGEIAQPTAHVFWDDRVDWTVRDDDLPCYGGASGTEKIA
jgi:hypothetical protein